MLPAGGGGRKERRRRRRTTRRREGGGDGRRGEGGGGKELRWQWGRMERENIPRNLFLFFRDNDSNHSENCILPLRFGIITGTVLGVLGNVDQNDPCPGKS